MTLDRYIEQRHVIGGEASAQLALTPQGEADGFTQSEFASGFPVASGALPTSYGPFGVAVNSDRNVIVLSGADDVNCVFRDVDGQTLTNALTSTPGPIPPAYAYSNGSVWGSTSAFPNGSAPSFALVKFNNDGTVKQIYDGIPTAVGLWSNPSNGHLIAEVPSFGIVDIDVSGSTPTFGAILSSPMVANGLTVSPDGTVAYVAGNEDLGSGSVFFVEGFRISDGSPVYGPFEVPRAVGVGIISDGPLNGDIEVTSDNGNLYLLDALGNLTTIATGGLGAPTRPRTGQTAVSSSRRLTRFGGSPSPSSPNRQYGSWSFLALRELVTRAATEAANVVIATGPAAAIGGRHCHFRAAWPLNARSPIIPTELQCRLRGALLYPHCSLSRRGQWRARAAGMGEGNAISELARELLIRAHYRRGQMPHSVDRFLTTHTGSLPRPDDLIDIMYAKEEGKPVDREALARRIRSAVGEVVMKQRKAGVDIVNDGEMSKPSYATYVKDRLSGFGGTSNSFVYQDLVEFPNMARRVFGDPGRSRRKTPACNGPIAVADPDAVRRDVDNLKSAIGKGGAQRAFMTAASPGVISLFFRNDYYPNESAYLAAISDAMRPEYEAIVAAGFDLQIDCPDLAMGRHIQYANLELPEFRKRAAEHVEALNGALANIPPERVRMHLCWGNYEGPHHCDVPLADIVDVVLAAKPAALSLEAANPRHAHEWAVFENTKLPEGKVLIPGVIESKSNFIEHPEVIANRIGNYAKLVGRENVIAGSDCGYGTWVGQAAVDPDIVWAKFAALTEGARIASMRFWR